MNSVLCRLALKSESMDPYSFTVVRALSASVTVLVILALKKSSFQFSLKKNANALALFSYLFLFSLAYVNLPAGTGALILFGSVQVTMMAAALIQGEKFTFQKLFGAFVAIAGLVYLLLPGIESPNPQYALFMIGAGIGWGAYSLLGRQSNAPIADTAQHFLKAFFLCALVLVWRFDKVQFSSQGLTDAILSGSLASGIGYSIWYSVLPRLNRMNASLSQLMVPVLAALGGVVFLGEELSFRLVIGFVMTLGGVGFAIVANGVPKQEA